MAETYFGIGKLNLLLFIVIYLLVLGLVISIFENVDVGKEWDGTLHSPFEDKTPKPVEDKSSLKKEVTNPIGLPNPMSPIERLSNGFAKLGEAIMAGLTILWIGLTVDTGSIPQIIKIFMATPVIVLLSIVIVDLLLDLIKAVKPDWL